MNSNEIFETYGCIKVSNFVDPQTITAVSQYFENKIRRGEWVENEADKTSKFSYYADPLTEVLLNMSLDEVEKVTGKELIPTYSYSRIYQPGEELTPHIDRPACEISVTVNVATKGEISPIYMKFGSNPPESHVLNPGDAVIYKGCEVLHWRHPLKQDQLNVQFMLHYVDKNGLNIKFAKDQRPAYGFATSRRGQ